MARKKWTEQEMAEAFPIGTAVRWEGHTGYYTVTGIWANSVCLYGGSLNPEGVRMARYAHPWDLSVDTRRGARNRERLVQHHIEKKRAVRKPRSTMTKRGN